VNAIKNKIHYAHFPRCTYSICGLYKYGKFELNGMGGKWMPNSAYYKIKLTRTKTKVTCKNCKRTKLFRGINEKTKIQKV